MLVRHRRTVVLVFLGAVLTAFIWSVTARPVFTATAMLRIEQGRAPDPQVRAARARRQRGRVRSDAAADRPPPPAEPRARQPGHRARGPRAPSRVSLGRPPAGELTDAFLERLQVEPVRNTRLVKVSFESRSPELAALVANTLADAVIAQQFDDKKDASQYATRFLTAQVNEARQALETSEAQLSQFLEENDILFVGGERIGERVGERQALISQELVDPVRRAAQGEGRAHRQGERARPSEPGDRRQPSRRSCRAR